MKLLLDQNLSPRLVPALQAAHPSAVHASSAHVRDFGLQAASDVEIWQFAKARGFAIASKDADFHQMSFLFGPPPKVIWLRIGNGPTDRILAVLVQRGDRLTAFESDEGAALLVLP